MIDAAERLVAERGLAAVSASEVLVAAGQRNKGAISYHFGTWDGLVEEILVTRMAEVARRRDELLRAIDREADPTTRDLVEALIRPFAERCIHDPSSCWARFLYRCMSDPHVATIVERSVEGRTFRSINARLVEHGAHVPDVLRRRRVHSAFATAVSRLADFEIQRDGDLDPGLSIDVVLSDVIDMGVAIIDQPASAQTLELLDRAHISTAS